MMRRASLVLLLTLCVPALAFAGSPRASGSQALRRIESTTEQIRGLRHTRGVTANLISDKSFASELTSEIRRDNPDSEIDMSQRESVLLGFLSKTQSLRQILLQDLSDQVVGLYDYHKKVLYVRSHANEAFGVQRHVIAHEYTHALQDQHWNMQKLLPDQYPLTYRNSDAVAAHHALTEGDAVNTETLFITRTYSSKEIQQLIKQQSQPVKSTPLPKAIDREFYFPYTTGVHFVQTLYSEGGMRAVNAAYRRLPSSTYEIMHPAAYLHHWRPVNVALHGVKGFDDWKQIDDDLFGAFGYKLLIWQFGSQTRANSVTDGYRGDRYIFLENGGSNAMLFKSVWTTSKAARAASSALQSSLRDRYSGRTRSTAQGSILADPDGAVYFHVSGNRLTMAYAPTEQLAQRLGTAPTS